MFKTLMCIVFLATVPSWAQAEKLKINDRDEFIRLVAGKTLVRPLVSLKVSPKGLISGRGAKWDVVGKWTWKNGFFCRDLFWGGSALGYNCQEVVATASGKLRFTSDMGRGRSADFRLE